MSKYKVAFIDVDNTLYDHSLHRYPPKSVEAVRRMAKEGIKVFICSARPYESLKGFGCFDLGIDWSGYIASSGGIGVVGDETIHEEIMDPSDVYAMIERIKALGLTAELITPTDRYMIAPPNDYSRAYHAVYRDETCKTRDYQGEKSTGLLLFSTKDYDEEIMAVRPNLVYFRFFDYGVDIMPSMHSKGVTISEVLNYLGVPKDAAIGFGDDFQDLPMAEATGCFVCMGNGREEVKRGAHYVAPTVSEDGLAKAIYDLVFEEEME